MDRTKYIQFIASSLIALVLTIPFYTTSVYAAINRIAVKGSDGIEGFAKSNDFLQFDVQASVIDDDKITGEQVVLGEGIKFDKCSPSISGGFECALRVPSNGTSSFEAAVTPFTVKLLNDNKTVEDSKSGTVVIDNKAPQVALSVSQSKFSSQQNVTIRYKAADFACEGNSCDGKCAGIKSIEFFTLNGSFNEKIDVTTSACTLESEIAIDSKRFNNGQNSVLAKATDKFNQISQPASVTFDMDNIGPAIMPGSFEIARKGIILNSFSPNKVRVDISVNISASDLNLNSVTADLSALNPSLKSIKASCSSVDKGLSVCKWSIDLSLTAAGQKDIVISASDTSGNVESATITKTLSLDNKGPVVQSLSTPSAKDGKSLGKASGNTVLAVFDEATGLSPDEVFLYVGADKIQAASCSKEANWVCVWNNVNFGSTAQMSIGTDTSDILGNAVSQIKTAEISLDNQAPVLRSINISPVGGTFQAFPGFFKVGDKIGVIANLTEENGLVAVADFSKFISEATNVAGACERIDEGTHLCAWLTDTINLQNADVITFNFTDSAGNSLFLTKSLKTFGLNNATAPDFWTNNVSCSPKSIDRQLGPLINQRVYCQVKLKPKSNSPSTVFIGQASCSGDTSVIDGVETFNTEAGSTSPVIKLTLVKDSFKVDNASLSCSFDVFSRIESSITGVPEIENAKINIQFYNLPLGELSDEVQRKIDDAVKDAQGIYKMIGSLNKLVNIAKKLCQLISTVYNVAASIFAIAGILGNSQLAICSAGPISWLTGACETAITLKTKGCLNSERASETGEYLHTGLKKACDMVTCKEVFFWGDDFKNLINSVPFSPFSPGQYIGPKTDSKSTTYDYVSEVLLGSGGKPRPISEYMDPRHNLIVATAFVCLPGIIYGLDKYRQIKCLYADCLQNAVSKDGLPITACEDQKSYATCKYVTGELFAVFPWTAVIDHYLGIIKGALSNPFTALGIPLAIYCKGTCASPGAVPYQLCRGVRLATLVGDAARNVQNIITEGFKVREDYCSRLETKKKSSPII